MEDTYTDTDISAKGQFRPIISGNQYVIQTLINTSEGQNMNYYY